MRVLVCGGRDFDGAADVARALGALTLLGPITVLMHGGATGADSLAGTWAAHHGVPVKVYPADWKRHGRKAGPLRNAEMLADGKPDIVVAFEGGAGTADMVRRARACGVNVVEVPGTIPAPDTPATTA